MRLSPSSSDPAKVMVLSTSSVAVTVCAVATGAVLPVENGWMEDMSPLSPEPIPYQTYNGPELDMYKSEYPIEKSSFL